MNWTTKRFVAHELQPHLKGCTHPNRFDRVHIVKGIKRYWGYLVLAVLFTAWWTTQTGPTVLILLSIAVSIYFLFSAPVWCGAVTRDGTLCRRNASGLLMGCSLRQHKWQKLKMAIVPNAWRQLNRGLWASPPTSLATLGTLAGIVSAIAATVLAIVK